MHCVSSILGTLHSWSLILYGTTEDPLSSNPDVPSRSVDFTFPTYATTSFPSKESAATSPRPSSKPGRRNLLSVRLLFLSPKTNSLGTLFKNCPFPPSLLMTVMIMMMRRMNDDDANPSHHYPLQLDITHLSTMTQEGCTMHI